MCLDRAPVKQLFNAVHGYLTVKEDPLVQDMSTHLPLSPEPRILPARTYPVSDHLAQAARFGDPNAADILAILVGEGDRFHWGQSYGPADFGSDFLNNYAYLEILGTRGHFRSDAVACGFLMIGPNTDYPAHRHEAEEIYMVLAGTADWTKAGADYGTRPPGAVIHHPSQVVHAIKTGAEPLLVLYLWRGGDLAQKSEIGGG
jgi:hypothetical protein